jgi:hypothetical protein
LVLKRPENENNLIGTGGMRSWYGMFKVWSRNEILPNTDKPVLRGHRWNKEEVVL